MSENRLLSVFFESDEDSNGFLDHDELVMALQRLVLEEKVLAKLRELIRAHKDAQDGDAGTEKGLSFACWFEIIGKFRQHDGFTAFHNPLVQDHGNPDAQDARKEAAAYSQRDANSPRPETQQKVHQSR